ncbi:hypothetical protein NDU88_003256 [Pleurodeles waltl]|uniref:Uncharacterized protein n=1 Tax=Pleurodeles waltl TaxID=8319 RepID=A0AAV7Q8G9_PLEWA|nr:hypothetical protein NDU88_003256 [Pleurodeles waltl]
MKMQGCMSISFFNTAIDFQNDRATPLMAKEKMYVQSPSDGLLLQSTDPPNCEDENPLSYPGAEGQRQRLRAFFGLNTGAGSAEGGETDGSRGSSRTTEDGRREDVADSSRSGDRDRDPESSTSGAEGAQRVFRPRLGKSVAPSGGWLS